MFKNALQPGERAPETGVYWVHHYQHRIAHAARIAAGTVLPGCLICGERVRFERAAKEEAAPDLGSHKDFSAPGNKQESSA